MRRLLGGLGVFWLGAVLLATVAAAQTHKSQESPEPKPAPDTASQAAESAFEVVLLALKSDWQAMRFHAHTGQAWYAFQGNWKPVPEADNNQPPPGDYRVQMSPTGESDWIAIRLERKSGRTWRLAALKWVEMKVLEPEKPKDDQDRRL